MAKIITTDNVVEEIMRIHRSLPPRPSIEEVEASKILIANVEREDQTKVEAIANENQPRKGQNMPQQMFEILQEMQCTMVHYQSQEQKKEALELLDLESLHLKFDDYIQRASDCLSTRSSSSSSTPSSSQPVRSYAVRDHQKENVTKSESKSVFISKDDTYMKKPKTAFLEDQTRMKPHPLKPEIETGEDGDRLNLIKLASLIEVSAKKGAKELHLSDKLSDQIEWLPDSIGKLSALTSLDLSENRIAILPETINRLTSLQKLDLHGNQIQQLPESIKDLSGLLTLDLRANALNSLPSSIDRLVNLQELDVSSNGLLSIPETIGSLARLERLNLETNDLEEIPHTIGNCASLRELRADYNRLKALPESVGRISTLEILTLRYNNVKQLPTTMASLTSLRELVVSFNELEAVPESLCFATTLVKMDVSNNFADLQSLPRSIGNLEMLEELVCNNNQIRVLPQSFGMLSRLRVLSLEGNPLSAPPREVIEKGAQAVVQYMADNGAQKEVKAKPVKQKKTWAQKLFFSKSNKRKRYAKT